MKSPFQDIIPQEKRSIRNISIGEIKSKEKDEPIPVSHTPSDTKHKKRRVSKDDAPLDKNIVFKGRKKMNLSRIILWSISAFCVTGAFLTLTHFLSAASVTVETKSWQANLPSKIPLTLQPQKGQVEYSTVILSDTISDTLRATGEKDVSTKASGSLIVYNNLDSNPQKLVAGTRFQSSKGLIYKLDKTITVPGVKKVSGKITPGSVVVSVTADNPGKDYNIELDDFSIPGFKGGSKYEKIYARSKTPMTGGASGKVATVDEKDLNQKVAELKAKLDLKIKEKTTREIPANQIIFDNLSTTDYVVSSPKFQDSKALVQVTENKKIYLINANSLAEYLISPQGANVSPLDEFEFNLQNATATFGTSTSDVSSVVFGGKVAIKSKLNIDKFKSSLVGVDKSEVPSITSKYPAISKITTEIDPFWKSKFPLDVSKIVVDIN